MTNIDALAAFHPVTEAWFRQALGTPTPPQQAAWPAIRAGKHTLIAAPTGSGKTLAAFYAEIDRLVKEGLQPGGLAPLTSVLYVSPLKALGNDIQRNLQAPLDGIAEQLQRAGLSPVDIRVAVRTGDTSPSARARMLKQVPHILVTTPESLYLLLTSKGGRQLLASVRSVILDEIHALLGDKRGSHLALSLERLENLVGRPLQRIGLSATQKPIASVAAYLVGLRNSRPDGSPDCEIIDSGHRKQLDIRVEVPRSPLSAVMANEVWDELYQRLEQLVAQHQTTLVFVNTRRLAERLALRLGERIGTERVSSHHGSMSKEHRFDAEQRLKRGELRVLVATASMELGIDIGAVDLVVQFSSPKRIAAFLQRVGRSGHHVGGVPKGILFPLTRDDLVESAALLDAIGHGELDRILIPDKPLDILAQQLVAELGSLEDSEQGTRLDDLWDWVSRAWVYRQLTRAEFDEVVGMLAEGYTTRRGRAGAWLHLDRINDRVRARKGARLTALTNGGAIPDMFDYQVVLDPDDLVVGSLNEDFALESLPGDIFTLGNRSWRLLRIDGLKVRVADAGGQSPTVPFWLGEGPGRSRELSEAVSRLRSDMQQLLFERSVQDEGATLSTTAVAAAVVHLQRIGLDTAAAEQVVQYLAQGRQALGVMPTRDTLVMERFFDEVGDMHLVIHAPFGARVNKAWGLALRKRFCRQFNFELQAAANEDSIVISLGSVHSFELDGVFRYLQSATVRDVLVQALLDAPMFEVRWRWNASRALAVARNRAGKRVPPQFQRMASEDFIAQVFPDQIACQENLSGPRAVPEHPLVRQTIHDCLTEAMDVAELTQIVQRIERGEISLVALDLREPSPFAQEIINARPYAFLDDAPFEERRTLAIRNRSWLDPGESGDYSALDASAIARVRDEAWPWVRSPDELHDALLSLGFMTDDELHGDGDNALFLEQLRRDGRATLAQRGRQRLWIASERQPLFTVLTTPTMANLETVASATQAASDLHQTWCFSPPVPLPPALAAETWSPETALVELLRGRLEGLGPVTAAQLAQPLGLLPGDVEFALRSLETEGFVFQGHYSPAIANREAVREWCERRLLQRIHRYTIDAHRDSIRPVSLQVYMQYLLALHGVQPVAAGLDEPVPATREALQRTLRQLDGVTAPAVAWEADILPSRLPHYDPAWLDQLCGSGQVVWGRILQASEGSGKGGPVKSSPLNLVQRDNLDLWQQLAGTAVAVSTAAVSGHAAVNEAFAANKKAVASTLLPSSPTESSATERLSSAAALLLSLLAQRGACFFADLVRLSGLLPLQVEKALAELVSAGRISSDGFNGLRALLVPDGHKSRDGRRRMPYAIEDAGRWSRLEPPPASSVATRLDDAQLDRLIGIYLERWGVLCRRILEREQQAPPWRVLLTRLRRLELRGELRGGCFINGVGGEQFAHADTVTALRKRQRDWQAGQEGQRQPLRHVINATDPLNLLGTLLPERRVSHLSGNRILFEDGLPVAILEQEVIKPLRPLDAVEQWTLLQLLRRRQFPPRLRAYLGKI